MIGIGLAVFAGFLTSAVITPFVMEFLRSSGIVGIDQQKREKPKLPTSGGIAVLFGFLMAISVFLGVQTFVIQDVFATEAVLAALCSVTIISLIGLIDDIHVKDEGETVKGAEQVSVGFRSWWIKPLLVMPASLPLMVVKAGHATMHVPFIGSIDFGIMYPLVLVPIGVICVSNATNMLAGQNGIEAGMGAVALVSLGLFAYGNGSVAAAGVALGMSASLVGFLIYNFYPARILPGDSLTYAVGATIVSSSIIANIERFSIVVFLPWIIEAFMKSIQGFQASSLGLVKSDGSLEPPDEGIQSLTHVLMTMTTTERGVVMAAISGETVLCIIAFMLFV